MSILKKLLKTTGGLQDEVDALVNKAIENHNKGAAKATKGVVKDVIQSIKDHDSIDKVATKAAIDIVKNAFLV